ncbi:hypothetical protein [Streptomyces sp. R33]|uniref:Uncharacterized protein n=1 Tax=Streptomyces sp. R33 TaxID=3238629 RepID=A0AB39XV61_9ACTN
MLNAPTNKPPPEVPPSSASQTVTNWLVPALLLLEITGRAQGILVS